MSTNSESMRVRPDPTARSSADSAGPDTYHDHDSSLNWAFRLEWAAWFPLVLAIVSFLLMVAELFIYLPQALRVGGFETYISISLPILIPLQAAIVAGALFVLLRAASEGLFLLLDIHDKPAAP
jgi:hypothetical protein